MRKLEAEERDAKKAFWRSLKGTDKQAIKDAADKFLEAGRRTSAERRRRDA